MKIIRGDTGFYKFQRKNENGEPILLKADKMYFTVKQNYNTSKILFQKTIDDITFDSEGYYHLTINPSDTDNLDYGNYVYDIEVIQEDDNYKKTISKGAFIVEKEVTFVGNEV